MLLHPLIKTATESELRYIASLDYGQDSERHLNALRSLIFEQGGDLQVDQYWYPHEVIALGSHHLADGHEREFFFCTMLLLQAVANGYDTSVGLGAKLSDRAGDYDRLPAALRDEVLRAYESAAA
jgi:hypothetical protein